jgi:hypothetical protein
MNMAGEKVMVTFPSGIKHPGIVVSDPAVAMNEEGKLVLLPDRVRVRYAGGYCSPERNRVSVVIMKHGG